MKEIKELIESCKRKQVADPDAYPIYRFEKSELLHLLSLVAEKQQDLDEFGGLIIENVMGNGLYIELGNVPLVTDILKKKQ